MTQGDTHYLVVPDGGIWDALVDMLAQRGIEVPAMPDDLWVDGQPTHFMRPPALSPVERPAEVRTDESPLGVLLAPESAGTGRDEVVLTSCRECRDGKCQNCDGTSWDMEADEPCVCACAEGGHV